MKQKFKRLLSFILMICIFLGVVPFNSVYASEVDNEIPIEVEENVESRKIKMEKLSADEKEEQDEKKVKEKSTVFAKEAVTENLPVFVSREEAVAQVEDKYYKTIEDAVDAVEAAGEIIIIQSHYMDGNIKIPNGKNIRIKDDGKKRTITKRNYRNINPTFIIEKNATLTLSASSNEKFIIKTDQSQGLLKNFSNKGSIVHNKGTFNFNSGTIRPGDFESKAEFAGGIYVEDEAVFNMSGGIIEEMTVDSSWYTSPVFVASGGTFNLSGGEIKNNKNNYGRRGDESIITGGGGVLLFNWNEKNLQATMNMSGGTISGNSAKHGGGIYMTDFTTLNMTGGTIKGNKAYYEDKGKTYSDQYGVGGGICVSGKSSGLYPKNSHFIMNGGTISGNSAKNGGGIYVNSDGVHLKKGYIEDNRAEFMEDTEWSGHGGGVYVSEHPRVLNISKAIVTKNKATSSKEMNTTSGMGGGLWTCPTGSINLMVTDGIAVFNNKSTGEATVGDDIVCVAGGAHPQKGKLTLPDRMLGGGQVKWAKDGQVNPKGEIGEANSDIPRFDEDNPKFVSDIKDDIGRYSLKAITTEKAIKRAYEEATLFIQNNEAGHGGGIGTNGDLDVFSSKPDIRLKVEKVWDSDISKTEKQDVKIFLKINNHILDYITLNEDNFWKGEFTELPNPETVKGKKISVIEGEMIVQSDGTKIIEETSSWDVSYTEKEIDEDILSVKVINKKNNTERKSKKSKPKVEKLNKLDHFAYINGYPDISVRPEGNITREEVATVFYRLLTDGYRASVLSYDNKFSDVYTNRWSNKEISTMANANIIKGYEDGTFRPIEEITRAEVAAIASRFDKLESGSKSFNDIKDHWAEEYIISAAEKVWVKGYEDNSFKPNKKMTRAEFATLVNGVLERKVREENILRDIKYFKDLEKDKWYYEAMVEATNSHIYEEKRLKDGSEIWIEIIKDREY